MNQKQLIGALINARIVQVNFENIKEDDLCIASILLEDGHLLTFSRKTPELTHPESDSEKAAFYEVLRNISPNGGIISFKSSFLSRYFVEQELSKKNKEIGTNGWGPTRETRDGYSSYRFDPFEQPI